MGKIRDYLMKHKTGISLALIFGSALSFTLYNRCKTRIDQAGEIFVVSNYDIGKGYRFVYNAEESGWEYLFEDRGEYRIFVDSDKKDVNEITTAIEFKNLGKNHPLNNKYIRLERCVDNSGFGKEVDIGETILANTREKYKEHIPFKKIKDKIKTKS